MTTLAPETRLNRPSKSLSVETMMKLRAEAYSRIWRSPAPASPSRRALSEPGKRSRNNSTSLGERLSSNRSFILRRPCTLPPIQRHKLHGQEVLRFQLGKIGQDLLLGCPA